MSGQNGQTTRMLLTYQMRFGDLPKNVGTTILQAGLPLVRCATLSLTYFKPLRLLDQHPIYLHHRLLTWRLHPCHLFQAKRVKTIHWAHQTLQCMDILTWLDLLLFHTMENTLSLVPKIVQSESGMLGRGIPPCHLSNLTLIWFPVSVSLLTDDELRRVVLTKPLWYGMLRMDK